MSVWRRSRALRISRKRIKDAFYTLLSAISWSRQRIGNEAGLQNAPLRRPSGVLSFESFDIRRSPSFRSGKPFPSSFLFSQE